MDCDCLNTFVNLCEMPTSIYVSNILQFLYTYKTEFIKFGFHFLRNSFQTISKNFDFIFEKKLYKIKGRFNKKNRIIFYLIHSD